MIIVINILGCILIALVAYWFWGTTYLSGKQQPKNHITIIVQGGVYQPNELTARCGIPLTLHFIRKDPSPCAEQVIFEDLSIMQNLPLNKGLDIHINHNKAGSYTFSCPMHMYMGTLHLVEQGTE